jgi:hypothetical protein
VSCFPRLDGCCCFCFFFLAVKVVLLFYGFSVDPGPGLVSGGDE